MHDPDQDLVAAATAVIRARFRPDWHVVGAALRLRTGVIVTGVHIDASLGRIAVCAEAVALGRAVTEHGSSDIETIVAVQHGEDGQIRVVAPCGMCREMIADYAPAARVLLPGADGAVRAETIGRLLPDRYVDPDEARTIAPRQA